MEMVEKVDVWQAKPKGDKMGKRNKKIEGIGQANKDNKISNQTKSQGGNRKALGMRSKGKGLQILEENLVLGPSL